VCQARLFILNCRAIVYCVAFCPEVSIPYVCFVPFEQKDRGRETDSGESMKNLRLHSNSFSCEASLGARQGSIAISRQFAASVYIMEQTRIFAAYSILLWCSRATSTSKSGSSVSNRRVYSSVSFSSEKLVQSGKIGPPCGAVVEYGLRGPALSADTASSCFCLSPLA
jgi:hypothetical protein